MCVIIHKPANKSFDVAKLENARDHNPHGFGIMFPHEGKVHVIKGMFDIGRIKSLFEEHSDKELAMHFRYATRGEKNDDNCHPFQVLNREQHGRDLWMMHNGTIREVTIKNQKMSDTWHFADDYMKPVLSRNPNLIDDSEFRSLIGTGIGNPNKLLFMDGEGKVFIINEYQGKKHDDGVWSSNQHSLSPKYKYEPYGSYNSGYKSGNSTTSTASTTQTVLPPKQEVKPTTSVMGGPSARGLVYDETLCLWYRPKETKKFLLDEDKIAETIRLTPEEKDGNTISINSNDWKRRKALAVNENIENRLLSDSEV